MLFLEAVKVLDEVWNVWKNSIYFLDTLRVEGKFNINFGESNLHVSQKGSICKCVIKMFLSMAKQMCVIS